LLIGDSRNCRLDLGIQHFPNQGPRFLVKAPSGDQLIFARARVSLDSPITRALPLIFDFFRKRYFTDLREARRHARHTKLHN
jgi:hypothetical protein